MYVCVYVCVHVCVYACICVMVGFLFLSGEAGVGHQMVVPMVVPRAVGRKQSAVERTCGKSGTGRVGSCPELGSG